MHGIVYVPESEAPSDPLEVEGVSSILTPMFVNCQSRSDGVFMEKAKVQESLGNSMASTAADHPV